jgi:hypothetical protein
LASKIDRSDMTLQHLDTVIAFVVVIAGVSLLVTTLTQMVSALFGLRGANLRWGIQTLLGELDPNLKAYAATISKEVLHHPLISDSTLSGSRAWLFQRWKLASAIRQDELIEILHMLVQLPPAQESQASDLWKTVLAKSLEQLNQGSADNLLVASPEIRKLFPNDPAKAEQVIAQLLTSAEHLSGSIDQWFDSMMDRVSQRFVVHMRIWTILFSVLLAFAAHLDALKLFTQLSSDPELRSRLVTSAEALSRKADEILATSSNAPAAVYVDAMKELISAHPTELAGVGQPSGFTDLEGGKAWLATQLETAKIPGREQWLQQYESLVPQAALRTAADNLNSILNDKLKFQLVPDPFPIPWYNYWTPSWLHFWGILVSAALLSLGAPFWFNMLKTLTNLRPVLANKEQEERQASGQN